MSTAPRPHTGSRRAGNVVVAMLLVVGVLVVAGGGWLLIRGAGAAPQEESKRDIHVVGRGSFDVVIPASGELAAMKQIEVVNRLESRAILTEIVPEGTRVKKGDVLFRLADEEIVTKIKDAQDAVSTAQAALVAAQSTLAVKESSAQSEEANAKLAIELARLALEAWEKGEEKSKRSNLEVAKRTAEINYERLVKKHTDSKRLFEAGHISSDELEQDRIAEIEAEARLQTAILDLEVYLGYTYKQDKAKKESDLEQAEAEAGRVKQRNEAEVGNAKAAVASAEYRLQNAKERLNRFNEQLGYCTVKAPSDGLVVYSTSLESSRWGNNDRTLQVGSELFPNQTVIVLPDTSQMIAAVKVNEALSGKIVSGQRVRVTSDAMPNRLLNGEVLSIGVLAESSGWRDPNRRDYTVKVLLTDADPELGLKPSMRCKAEIVVDSVLDALSVPIQAIFRKGAHAFVYRAAPGGYEAQPVQTGRASETLVEILAGLSEGDRVLLREPGPEEIVKRFVVPDGPSEGGRERSRSGPRELAAGKGEASSAKPEAPESAPKSEETSEPAKAPDAPAVEAAAAAGSDEDPVAAKAPTPVPAAAGSS